jgi:hypothetical protein
MTRATPKLLFVCIAQAVMAWLFYRSRAVTHLAWAESDLVVFVVPLVLGFAFSALVLSRSASSRRGVPALAVAAVCALISSFVGTVIGFNLYGT